MLPLLRELVAATRESAAFHVRQGDQRAVPVPRRFAASCCATTCAQATCCRWIAARGAVSCLLSRANGRLYDQIRRDGYLVRTGDRVEGLTGISAPVWDSAGDLVGALTLTLPEQRMKPSFVDAVRRSALLATRSLGGTTPDPARVQ